MKTRYIDFAEYYDYDHDIRIDIPFYLDYAYQCRSPILELASGTGRRVIPLAKAGFDVYGVDLSDKMLEVCGYPPSMTSQKSAQQYVHRTAGDSAAISSSFHALAFYRREEFNHEKRYGA